MKKLSFTKIFFITLTACSIPMYGFIKYIAGDHIFPTTGPVNAVATAVIVSMLPALLIGIWWWNLQYQDDMDDYQDEMNKK
jgi:hypothetical protein